MNDAKIFLYSQGIKIAIIVYVNVWMVMLLINDMF